MPATQKYDPTAEQPYVAPQLPDATPVMPQQPQFTNPGPQQPGRGGISIAGAIAQMGDSILRGYTTGRAQYKAQQVMATKRQQDNLQTAYNQAAENLQNLHQAGTDPNSDEYKKARSAVDGTWKALTDFYGQHVNDDQPKKKGGKKQSQANQQGNILGDLTGTDPNAKIQAWWKVMQQAGPPVYYKLGTMDPKAIQARKDAATAQEQANALGAQNDLAQQKLIARQRELSAIQPYARTADQVAELASVNAQLNPAGSKGTAGKDEAQQIYADVLNKHAQDPKLAWTENDRNIVKAATGHDLTEKPMIAKGRDGNVLITPDGQGGYSYDTITGAGGVGKPYGGGSGGGGTGGGKPIPAGTQGTWETQKDKAIGEARQLFEQGYYDSATKQTVKISKEEYLKRWQQAQDTYEAKYRDAGHPKEHFDVSQYWAQQGYGQSQPPGKEHLGVPENVRSGPTSLPPHARAKLVEGKVVTFGNGQHWLLHNGQPVQVDNNGQPI